MVFSIYSHIFHLDGRFFLFNSESLFFSEISEKFYEILNGRQWCELSEEILSQLKEKRIIVPKDEKYSFFYASKSNFLNNAYGSDTLSLVVAPTTGCNFECPYCFEPKKNPKSISTEDENRIIDFVNKQDRVDKIRLTWYGGEPLLMKDAILSISNRLKAETKKEIQFQEIITNAYLIDDDVIKIFQEIGLNRIQISIDGTESNHNKTRFLKDGKKPTFKRIETNLESLAKAMPLLEISLRVNINKQNCDDFIAIYEKYQGEDWHRNIYPYPGIIREDSHDRCRLCHTSYSRSDMVWLYDYFRSKGVRTNVFPRHQPKGCMMNRSSAFIIGPEGELYKCWNDVSKRENAIGSIMDSKFRYNARLMQYMLECTPYTDECKECKVFPICDGGCGMLRFRNKFENSEFQICSAYKDENNLNTALVTSTIPETDEQNKMVVL